MIDLPIPYDLEPLPYLLVGTTIAVLALARMHASDRWWCPDAAWFWWPLRRHIWPPVDNALERVPMLYAKTGVREEEVVCEGLDVTIEQLHQALGDVGYEAQPLASVARLETTGELERSSIARYRGPKLSGLPEWLRRYQVHIRPFGEDSDLTVTAHHEYNPWHPIYALPHLFGIGLDADRGVELADDDVLEAVFGVKGTDDTDAS